VGSQNWLISSIPDVYGTDVLVSLVQVFHIYVLWHPYLCSMANIFMFYGKDIYVLWQKVTCYKNAALPMNQKLPLSQGRKQWGVGLCLCKIEHGHKQ
jgi:hypothetical protein